MWLHPSGCTRPRAKKTVLTMPTTVWSDSLSDDETSLPPIPNSWKINSPTKDEPSDKKNILIYDFPTVDKKKLSYNILMVESDDDSN